MRCNRKADENKTNKGLGSRINYQIQGHITHKQLNTGNVSDKIPIALSDGRSIVFAKCQEDVDRVREFWEKKIHKSFNSEAA